MPERYPYKFHLSASVSMRHAQVAVCPYAATFQIIFSGCSLDYKRKLCVAQECQKISPIKYQQIRV